MKRANNPVAPLYEYAPAERDGLPRPVLHLAHANGFPPEVYAEMASSLAAHYRMVTLPARPLWEPAPLPETLTDWAVMADDLIVGLEAHELGPVVGVGHSMGGTASLLAAIKRPDLFRALVLLDPVLLPRKIVWLLAGGPDWLPKPEFPLVKKALRRRREWRDKKDAFDRFRQRALFKRWSDAAIWAYIDGLTEPVDNASDAIQLRYSPEWEAQIYRTAPHSMKGWWRWLRNLTVPTTVLQGAETDTFVDGSANLWKKQRPDLPVITIPKTGHLFPMEAPTLVVQHIMEFLGQIR